MYYIRIIQNKIDEINDAEALAVKQSLIYAQIIHANIFSVITARVSPTTLVQQKDETTLNYFKPLFIVFISLS